MRDLAGWCLSILLWTYPAILLATFVGWVEGDLYAFAFFLTLVCGFAWPGLHLLSRRLREASDLDRAEADGRAPVLVVHTFERTVTPLWQRLFPTPAFFRDVGDELLVRALRSSLEQAGPVIVLERPAPPPTHGPMSLATGGREHHEEALLAHTKRAQLVALVLDGSETMRREIGRLAEAIDVRRIVLVVSPRADHAFFETWAGFRAQLPGLPPLDAKTAAVRFGKGAEPTVIDASYPAASARRSALAQAHLLLRESERVGAPTVPSWSWVLSSLPIGMALVSTILTPVFAEEHHVSISSSEEAGFGFLSLVLGVLLAISSRRVMRLVPASELPLVLLAASPWIFIELVAATRSDSPWQFGEAVSAAATGAAYAAPLLWVTSIVLAGASLMRKSPGRRASFGLFGLSVVVPLLALALSLGAMGVDVGGLALATLATGGALALATVAASGDAGRKHAPLSIGSAACATLALGAWATVVTHGEWRRALFLLESGDYADRSGVGARLAPLLDFDAMWVWFLLALPCVVLVGLLFHGRSTKPAARDAATLLPLALLLTMAASTHARARTLLDERGVFETGESWTRVAGPALAPGFELAPIVSGDPLYGPIDLVLDRGGALMGGRRVSSELEMASFGAMGASALSAAVAERVRDREARNELRLAVAPDASGQALLTACRAAWAQGAPDVQVVGRDPSGRPLSVLVRQHFLAYDPRDGAPVELYVMVRPGAVTLESTAGDSVPIERTPDGRLLDATVGQALALRRQVEPNRRALTVVVLGGASAGDVLTVLAAARYGGYDQLSFDDHWL